MLSQLGIFTVDGRRWRSPSSDASLPVTALFAVLLAFWTTTLEVAADAWRIELAPTQAEQGPIVAANLWGYRSAMVAAGSGALLVADQPDWGWTGAYLRDRASPRSCRSRSSPRCGPTPGQAAAAASALADRAGRQRGDPARALRCVTAAIGWVLLDAPPPASGSAPRPTSRPGCWRSACCRSSRMAVALPRIRHAAADAPVAALGRDRALCRFLLALRLRGAAAAGVRLGLPDGRRARAQPVQADDQWRSAIPRRRSAAPTALVALVVEHGRRRRSAAGWRRAGGMGVDAGDRRGRSPRSAISASSGSRTSRPSEIAALHRDRGRPVRQRHRGRGVRRLSVDAGEPALSRRAICLPVGLRLPAAAAAGGRGRERSQRQIGYDGFFLLSGALSLAAIVFLPFIARAAPRTAPRTTP